jgi:hypothetical protein
MHHRDMAHFFSSIVLCTEQQQQQQESSVVPDDDQHDQKQQDSKSKSIQTTKHGKQNARKTSSQRHGHADVDGILLDGWLTAGFSLVVRVLALVK